MSIICGDCLEVMKTFPDNHFSAIVTDPPYGLHFMGKDWDNYSKGSVKCGRKILGAHTNSEAHEAARYDERRNDEFERFMFDTDAAAIRILKPGGHVLMFGAPRRYHRQVCALEDAGFEIRDCLMWIFGSGFPKSHNRFGIDGYGTALKPAYEPIIMAMKPCDGTFKQNASKWGQAGINIDGCRIDYQSESDQQIARCERSTLTTKNLYEGGLHSLDRKDRSHIKGRWPANIILDEEAAEQLGDPSRFFYCAKTSSKERNEGLDSFPDKVGGGMCSIVSGDTRTGRVTIQKNNHPTVKPLKLMEYLIKLVMPPKGGLLLDPFAGSGSTILAAKNLGFDAIGIEKCQEYTKIALARLAHKESSAQVDMFLENN